jgi:hypothetical protein
MHPKMKLTPLTIASMLAAAALGGCGSQSISAQKARGRASVGGHGSHESTAATAIIGPGSSAPIVGEPGQPGPTWRQIATVGGQPAAWIARRSGVTLLRFDQQLVHLALHAGSSEPGGHGWTYGDRIGAGEIHRVVAAFNGGFKLSYGSVGYLADGHTAVALQLGLGSIVTYQNGTTGIGAWHEGVPVAALKVASVLENLHLLVDRAVVAPSVEDCIQACWGDTLGGGPEVARSALGITGDGQLVWAGGEQLSPATIAQALVAAGAVRAVELDINPEWVAGYLYMHHRDGPTVVPVVPGQFGIPGRFLTPYGRDFFTILAK